MSTTRPERTVRVDAGDGCLRGRFFAMGSPCELLVDSDRDEEVEHLARLVAAEAWRIEDKLSRYLDGNVIDRINRADGKPVDVDEETAQLIDFAATLHDLSDARFDITSGVLRRVWHFDCSDNVPSQDDIDEVMIHVGWGRVEWDSPRLRMPAGMEIDLGGIGKEYAVDRCGALLREKSSQAGLINFGGDLLATSAPAAREAWKVGIDSDERLISLGIGALATSGDARRFLLRDGVRYGHILDPTTGWPVEGAPASITVAADTCTQAGMLSTLAMLNGAQAEAFLEEQGVQFWRRIRGAPDSTNISSKVS